MMFQLWFMLLRKFISAPGRSGNSKRNRISSLASGAWPPTRWRRCSLAISLSREVERGQFAALQFFHQIGSFRLVFDLDADEHLRRFRVGVAVVEFGDVALAEQRAELAEAAGRLGDGDGEDGFALLADLGALGDEAQTVEVHVRAACDAVISVSPLSCSRLAYSLAPAMASAPAGSRMERVSWNTSLIAAHTASVSTSTISSTYFLQMRKRFFADQLDRRAVREQADIVERDALLGFERSVHGIGIGGLHADDLDVGAHLLDVSRHARDQSAAADGAEDGVDGRLMLAQDFHADGALSGDDIGIVERMHEGELLFFLEFLRVAVGIAVAVAVQHDLHGTLAEMFHRVDLYLRRGGGHHDDWPCSPGDAR